MEPALQAYIDCYLPTLYGDIKIGPAGTPITKYLEPNTKKKKITTTEAIRDFYTQNEAQLLKFLRLLYMAEDQNLPALDVVYDAVADNITSESS